MLDLISLTWFVLQQSIPYSKDVAIVTGRFVFGFQLRRQLMCILHEVWM